LAGRDGLNWLKNGLLLPSPSFFFLGPLPGFTQEACGERFSDGVQEDASWSPPFVLFLAFFFLLVTARSRGIVRFRRSADAPRSKGCLRGGLSGFMGFPTSHSFSSMIARLPAGRFFFSTFVLSASPFILTRLLSVLLELFLNAFPHGTLAFSPACGLICEDTSWFLSFLPRFSDLLLPPAPYIAPRPSKRAFFSLLLLISCGSSFCCFALFFPLGDKQSEAAYGWFEGRSLCVVTSFWPPLLGDFLTPDVARRRSAQCAGLFNPSSPLDPCSPPGFRLHIGPQLVFRWLAESRATPDMPPGTKKPFPPPPFTCFLDLPA